MRFIATGRVHPERTAAGFTTIEMGSSDGGTFTVSCDASQLSVVLNHPSIQDSASAKTSAEHFAQSVVSALGYSLGCGYSVEITQVVAESGHPTVFGVQPGRLGFEPNNPTFEHTLRLAIEDLFFRLALRDYVRALTDEIDCALYCYRAIESLRSSFEAPSESESWVAMHAALGTTRELIQDKVKAFADPIRHGNWASAPPVTSRDRLEMLRITRDILHKYLEHRRLQKNS